MPWSACPQRGRANLARTTDFLDIRRLAVRASDACGHGLATVYADVCLSRDFVASGPTVYESHLATSCVAPQGQAALTILCRPTVELSRRVGAGQGSRNNAHPKRVVAPLCTRGARSAPMMGWAASSSATAFPFHTARLVLVDSQPSLPLVKMVMTIAIAQ